MHPHVWWFEGSYSSGSSTLLFALSKNWPLKAAAKKGDSDRTSSCAAKRRWSRPTIKVTIGLVRVLHIDRCQPPCPMRSIPICVFPYLPTGGLSKFCDNFALVCSRYDLLLGLTDLPARSLLWKDRLNMLIEVENRIAGDDYARKRQSWDVWREWTR